MRLIETRVRRRLASRTLALLLLTAPAASLADDSPGRASESDPPSTSAADTQSTSGGQSRPLEAWLDADGVTGDWFGWRTRLADRGFTPYAYWMPEVLRNFAGGLQIRTDWEGLFEFGASVDLEKAVAWNGAELRVSALWIQGNNDPSPEFVGTFDELSNIAGSDGLRLFQLYMTQEFQDETWTFKFGQIALDTNFMVSNTASLFLNSSFGALPVESANTPAPIWPLGALGGMVTWKPHTHVKLRMGIYNGDAGTETTNRHGLEYAFGKRQGVMLMSEVELDWTLLHSDGTYKLGGYYHSGDFTDFSSGRTVTDNYALYVIADQILIGHRDDNVLAAFFRAGWSPLDDRNPVHWYLDGGMSMRGFRQADRVGLGVSHTRFGSEFVASEAASNSPIVDDETIVELTYHAQLTAWLSLQPDLQYVIDPVNRDASDAVVGGLRGRITF